MVPNETKPPAYLAIDPGDTSGWATFDEDGNLIGLGQVKESDFVKEFTDLLTSSLKHVIIEDYVLFQHRAMAQTNSRGRKLKTPKMVGKLEMLAELRGVPYTKQESSRYPIGAMWGGFEIPSNHAISHQYVAAAHGVFWLQSNGIRKPGQGDKNGS